MLVAIGTPEALERLESRLSAGDGGRVSAPGVMSAPLDDLRAAVHAAAAAVRGDDGGRLEARVERPKRAGQGDYSTNVAMLLAPPWVPRRARSPSGWGRP